MFQSKRPNATIPFMEAESITCNKRGQPENPFLPLHTSLSPRVLLIVNRVCVCLSVSIKNLVLLYYLRASLKPLLKCTPLSEHYKTNRQKRSELSD